MPRGYRHLIRVKVSPNGRNDTVVIHPDRRETWRAMREKASFHHGEVCGEEFQVPQSWPYHSS